MYINFQNAQAFADRLDAEIKSLVNARERLTRDYKTLEGNSGLEDVLADIKRIRDKLNEEIMTAAKLRAAVLKVCELYRNGENNIEQQIEENWAWTIGHAKLNPMHFIMLGNELELRIE